MALTDKSWELIDPNPNVLSLFQQYNEVFFYGRLGSVVVEWSKRMTSCAGTCSYTSNNGFCVIRLSEPLLKFRPRTDLIETLIHEMIHAFLFVTVKKVDHEGHGPDFLEHMYRINEITGLHISVYHSFHEEVRYHQKHHWLCNGPCQFRSPYYGQVRRAINRAPGPSDHWWSSHQATCKGTFVKVVNNEVVKKTPDIRKFFVNGKADKPTPMNLGNKGYAADGLHTLPLFQDRQVGPSYASSTAMSGTLQISAVSNNGSKSEQSKNLTSRHTTYKINTAIANYPLEIKVKSDGFFTLPTHIKMLFDENKTVEYIRQDKENTVPLQGSPNAFINLCDDSD